MRNSKKNFTRVDTLMSLPITYIINMIIYGNLISNCYIDYIYLYSVGI